MTTRRIVIVGGGFVDVEIAAGRHCRAWFSTGFDPPPGSVGAACRRNG